MVALEPGLLIVDRADVALERLLGAEHRVASRTLAGGRPQVDDVDMPLQIVAVSEPTAASFANPRL